MPNFDEINTDEIETPIQPECFDDMEMYPLGAIGQLGGGLWVDYPDTALTLSEIQLHGNIRYKISPKDEQGCSNF